MDAIINHTPGPWLPRQLTPNRPDTAEETASGLGWTVDGPPQPLLRGQFAKAADAWLTAASPELLVAAEQLLTLVRQLYANPCNPALTTILTQAEKAIQKARPTGGAQAPHQPTGQNNPSTT